MATIYKFETRNRHAPMWTGTHIGAVSVALAVVFAFVVGLLWRDIAAPLNDGAPTETVAFSGAPLKGPSFRSGISVTDGDTVSVHGQAFRLVGFNAPETYRPECAREKDLGVRARQRTRRLVAGGDVELVPVPCSCPAGTEGTEACNYGRSCGILRVSGRDVGAILVSEGLAVPFHCGIIACPRTPRPWCG